MTCFPKTVLKNKGFWTLPPLETRRKKYILGFCSPTSPITVPPLLANHARVSCSQSLSREICPAGLKRNILPDQTRVPLMCRERPCLVLLTVRPQHSWLALPTRATALLKTWEVELWNPDHNTPDPQWLTVENQKISQSQEDGDCRPWEILHTTFLANPGLAQRSLIPPSSVIRLPGSSPWITPELWL